MYSEELQKIAAFMRRFYGCREMPAPAKRDSMEHLLRKSKEVLQRELPREYTDFLRECDGLECNGHIIYGADDFWEKQTDYPAMAERYLTFADYDTGWFCMKKTDASFWELDKPSGREMRRFPCAGDMLRHILLSAAGRAVDEDGPLPVAKTGKKR